jgi:anaerobic magnesium-protoporphyrin IX monomethyl ester cyclase
MKLAFLNPPFLPGHGKYSREQRSPAITKSGTFYYPMWLSYAAGFLESQGHEVKLWDAPAKRVAPEFVIAEIERFRPDMLVVATSTPSIYSDVAHAASIKALLPDLYVVLVGVHVTALPAETLELDPAIDAAVIGEYEITLSQLASRLSEGGDPVDMPGLAYKRRSDNTVVVNGPRDPVRNLDSIPWVTRTYRKHLDYRDYFYSGNRFPVVVMVTSRGCPNKCIFCCYPQTVTGRAWRTRSVEDVEDEMEYVVREFSPFGEIMFEDDTFTSGKERTTRFCEEVLRRGLRVRWSCNARADLDEPTMKLMRRAGCRSLLVGFESGSQALLDEMSKGTSLAKFRQFMADSKKAGLLVNGAFLVGMPGETKETMEMTLRMAKSLNPDVAQFFPVMVYPGTRIYDKYLADGYITSRNYRDYLTEDGLHRCIVNLPNISAAEIVEFCDRCRREFYLRPRYLGYKLLQLLTDPAEGTRTIKAFRTFGKHLLFGTRMR